MTLPSSTSIGNGWWFLMRENLRDVWVMFVYFGSIGVVWSGVRAWLVNRDRVWPMRHYNNKEDN